MSVGAGSFIGLFLCAALMEIYEVQTFKLSPVTLSQALILIPALNLTRRQYDVAN